MRRNAKQICPTFLLTLGIGGLGGTLNGWLITRWRFPPLVVTLATMALFRGGAMAISRAQPISEFPDWFAWFGQRSLGPFPVQLLLWLLLLVATVSILGRTPIGRYTTAIGDHERAAKVAALPVEGLKFWLYAGMGFLSAVAAVVFTSRVSTAKADAGQGLELEVITAVVLGGTSITGGRGTALGNFLGVLILGVVRNGLSLAGILSVWQTMLAGAILIATAVLNQRLKRG